MSKKELEIKNVLLIMQTALATIVFAVSIGYIFEKSYLLAKKIRKHIHVWQIFLSSI